SFFRQRLNDSDGRRLADVVGARLERQTEHSQSFSSQGPERASHFVKEAATLVVVDPHDLREKTEVVAALSSDRVKRLNVLGEARTSVADSGVEESRTDPAVGTYTRAHLAYVCADSLRNIGDRIDKRYFHGEESVRGVFD